VVAHNNIVFCAAGRTPLADGGVYLLAVNVRTGKPIVRQAIDSLDMRHWYGRLAIDYDPVDLLCFDGEDKLAMSRARMSIRNGAVSVDRGSGAFYRNGASGAFAPVGIWSYGLAMRRKRVHRPLYVFDDTTLYGGEPFAARSLPRKCPASGGREWDPYGCGEGPEKG
jgi:hypothetical protein